MKRLDWSIGKEGTTATDLEKPPFRVFFREFEDEVLVNSLDLSEDELVTEIERRKVGDEVVAQLTSALRELRKHNGSKGQR
jgi:hypothetical protein